MSHNALEELERAEARIEELEATLQQERLSKWKVLKSPLKTRMLEAEAKLARATDTLARIVRLDDDAHKWAIWTLAELKAKTDD